MDQHTEVLFERELPGGELLRVSSWEYKGKKYFGIQRWWRRNDEDAWKPGKGISVLLEDAGLILDAVRESAKRLEWDPEEETYLVVKKAEDKVRSSEKPKKKKKVVRR